ncbi:hypothetical protein BT69DRAFT_1291707 [Atractiella rhizophila]|nr:hypothetical protein BT69DRAFT_1291707 [Atractiella rhizophila]
MRGNQKFDEQGLLSKEPKTPAPPLLPSDIISGPQLAETQFEILNAGRAFDVLLSKGWKEDMEAIHFYKWDIICFIPTDDRKTWKCYRNKRIGPTQLPRNLPSHPLNIIKLLTSRTIFYFDTTTNHDTDLSSQFQIIDNSREIDEEVFALEQYKKILDHPLCPDSRWIKDTSRGRTECRFDGQAKGEGVEASPAIKRTNSLSTSQSTTPLYWLARTGA